MRYHMDGCRVTNQFTVGGLGLLCSTGVLESVAIALMVAGHTKFDPDLVDQHVVGGYYRRETFNNYHPRNHVDPTQRLLAMTRHFWKLGGLAIWHI